MNPSNETLLKLLKETKTIAVVGLSPKADRPSHRVAAYMQKRGYTIIPVRPGCDTLLGEKAYASLDEIPSDIKVDMVDVFRKAEDTPPIAEAAARIGAKSIWLQQGIINSLSMQTAEKAGLTAVQDLCLMVEHRRLLG
uniref:CoA-binding domain-containing protein n=1 Tax=Magnetococcus massalia (strain MO-1) TaxID=451514 RepID=A0A1S7LN01_MAGMO|nr:Conserved protein of unknown function [Candidatus Magnetococcus massalia]